MISVPVLGSIAFAALATLFFPVVLLVVLCVKRKISPRPMTVGILAFFISQVCIRLPVLSVLGMRPWFQAFAKNSTVVYLVALSFSAGLFEETARYVGVRFFLKNQRKYRDAVAFGLGHGLCEAVLLVGVSELGMFVVGLMVNGGAFNTSVAAAKQTVDSMLKITPVIPFLAVWERVSSVMFHLFATVLIFRAVRERKILWYFAALAAHTVLDSVSGLLVTYTQTWICELAVFVLGALGFFYVLKVKARFDAAPEADPAVPGIGA